MGKRAKYEVIVERSCERALTRIARSDRKLYQQFDETILALENDPRPHNAVTLKRTARYDLCRVPVRCSWRLIYAVIADKLVILLLDAVVRREAYDNLDVLISRAEAELEISKK